MRHGEVGFAEAQGGGSPLLILLRDPAPGAIGSAVVEAIMRIVRGLVSELPLTATTVS